MTQTLDPTTPLVMDSRDIGAAEERRRLAREVHDTLAQYLSATALQLQVARRLLWTGADPEDHIQEAQELTHRALDEARRIIWGGPASVLGGRSLVEALANEVEEFGRRTRVLASFTQIGGPVTLDDERSVALIRVAQEALHNVERHAAAQRVRVELESDAEAGEVRLLVADDGCGFALTPSAESERPPASSFGLISMDERARLAGGQLDVESAPGWGTRVRVRVPIASPNHASLEVKSDTAQSDPVRVLIVDDYPLARQGLRRALEEHSHIDVVGDAPDASEALELAVALRPDVILMDLQMPRVSGVTAIRLLRQAWPEARILVLTAFAQDEYLFEALRAGARGYLLKSAEVGELVDAIQEVHAGGTLVAPSLTPRLVERLSGIDERGHVAETLTEREAEVLRLLATGARNRDIAEQLVITEKTVKHHIGQIHAKLGVRTRTEAVARARRLGLLPLDDFALA
jgi:DNA-binding NarL/FixJ family response regulator/two-component sensor histidine kinase